MLTWYPDVMRITFFLLAMGMLFGGTSQAVITLSTSLPAAVPAFNKVIWVWLENTSYQDMMAQKYTKNIWFNIGAGGFSNFKPVSKVTQGNVIAMISGNDFGVTDNEPTLFGNQTLVDLMESKNISWNVYVEDFPGGCYQGAGVGEYKRYRVPFLSFSAIRADRFLCSKIVSYTNYEYDRNGNNLPQVSIVIPNLRTSGATTNAATADQALQNLLSPIVSNPDLLAETTIFISTTNMVDQTKPAFAMIFGKGVNINGTTSSGPTNHYQILKTLEVGLNLGNLNQQDATAEPVTDIWK